ncbi:MAG: hypothetical protein ACYTGZ_16115 [Planctomycetota bacterium]|jgi:hypothetical protein
MRNKLALASALVIALSALGFAAEDIGARIDRLLHRWTKGDAAARTGVAAETRALGDEAIGDLYRRLARKSFDFPAPEIGVTFSEAGEPPTMKDLVNVEVRFVTPQEGAKLPARAGIVEPEKAAALIKAGSMLSAPRLTVYDRQRANVSVITQKQYVRTIDAANQPIKGTVQEGLVLELRPQILSGGKFISVEMRCLRSDLDGEIAEIEAVGGKIGAPVVIKREFAVTIVVESGAETVLFVPGDKPLLVQVKVRRIDVPMEIELR